MLMHMCVVSVNMQERRRKEVIARKRLERAQDKDGLHIEVLVRAACVCMCVCVCVCDTPLSLSRLPACLPASLTDPLQLAPFLFLYLMFARLHACIHSFKTQLSVISHVNHTDSSTCTADARFLLHVYPKRGRHCGQV